MTRSKILFALAFIGFLYLWFIFTDSWRSESDLWSDLICLAAVTGLVILVKTNAIRSLSHMRMLTFVWASFWLTASVIDVYKPHQLPATGKIEVEQLDTTIYEGKKAGLALSGGGYRAALFHAGVVQALHTIGIEPRNISAVSGGAIFGSYYHIGGTPVDFRKAVERGTFNLKRELMLAHNLIRLPFPFRIPFTDIRLFPWYSFSRLDVQRRLIERTTAPDRDTTRGEERTNDLLMINTTDLRFGIQIAAFNDSAIIFGPERVWENNASLHKFAWTTPPSIAKLVSYSGAFPGAFPAADELIRVGEFAGVGRGVERAVALADGGIIDNDGVTALAAISDYAATVNGEMQFEVRRNWESDFIIASDGSALFEIPGHMTSIGTFIRAFGVTYEHKPSTKELSCNWNKHLYRDKIVRVASIQLPATTRLTAKTRKTDGEKIEDSLWADLRPLHIQPAMLQKIVELLPGHKIQASFNSLQKGNYTKLANELTPADRRAATKWLRSKTHGECVAKARGSDNLRSLTTWDTLCHTVELRQLIQARLRSLITTFADTSTLKDVITQPAADEIYNLAQLLTYNAFAPHSTSYHFRDQRDKSALVPKDAACRRGFSRRSTNYKWGSEIE